jgi:putative NADH-flavin reductase
MKIAVFGATGRTGVPLVRQALDRGHEVVAFARSPEKLGIEDDRLTVVEGDVYTGEGVAEAVADADAVVSVLGQTGDGPDDLLTVAGERVTAAMAEAGVDRYVTLVGAGVRMEGESVSLAGRVIGTALRLLQPEILEEAENHVAQVRETDLRWTVVRAPRLSEDDPLGDYETGDVTPGRKAIPRADVAEFMLDCVDEELYVGELPLMAR